MVEKQVSDSKTEQVHIVMPEHINSNDRLFGGQLMEWIDVVAAVTARRHANCLATTAAVDSLVFEAPAYAEDTVVLQGQITYVGHTSMEVRVDSFVEHISGERKRINRAYFVMVAIDRDHKPQEVPKLIVETEEQKREWEAGKKRYALRQQRRLEKY